MFQQAPPDGPSRFRGSHCPPGMTNGYDSVQCITASSTVASGSDAAQKLQARRPAIAPHHSSPAAFLYPSPTAQVAADCKLHLCNFTFCWGLQRQTVSAAQVELHLLQQTTATLGTNTASCSCTASCKVAPCYGNRTSYCIPPCKLPCLCSHDCQNDGCNKQRLQNAGPATCWLCICCLF